jgi:hypothetical protein
MSFTAAELQRIEDIEEKLIQLAQLVKGGGSINQLNRLLVLAQNKAETLSSRVTSLETRSNTILSLVQRLQ